MYSSFSTLCCRRFKFRLARNRASDFEKHLGFEDSEIFLDQRKLKGSALLVETKPGLGITIGETLLKRKSLSFGKHRILGAGMVRLQVGRFLKIFSNSFNVQNSECGNQ